MEPASEIVKDLKQVQRHMGLARAHESLAIAMNRLGGKSNTGEGGEDMDRFTPDENGDSGICHQTSSQWSIWSNQFYLVNSDEIQIKIVQNKPEGEFTRP